MESFQIFEHVDLVHLAIEYEFVALEGRVFDVLEGVYAFRWLCIHHQGLRVEVETVVENKKEENLYSHTATVVRSIVMKYLPGIYRLKGGSNWNRFKLIAQALQVPDNNVNTK